MNELTLLDNVRTLEELNQWSYGSPILESLYRCRTYEPVELVHFLMVSSELYRAHSRLEWVKVVEMFVVSEATN